MPTTLRREPRLEPPPAPGGRLALRPPPALQPHEGTSAALMNALPMLGSIGAMVFVAASQPGPRGYIAAGMFLLASLGFVLVGSWRQRSMRESKVGGLRWAYLRYLAEIRHTARDAAHRQRESLTWSHPDPDHLAVLAEEGTRVWERSATDPRLLRVRYGLTAQPLALELLPPEDTPVEHVDPVAASALHRLLATHRIQPDLPAAVELAAFARIELTAQDDAQARGLARAIVAEAAAFHSPEQLLVAVVASDQTLPEWEWVKWLPHAHSPREYDAAGPARLVATSMAELVPLLPADLADRPRFGPTRGGATLPHVLVVVDRGQVPPGNHLVTEGGVLGVTVLELPDFCDDLDDSTRLRLHLPGEVRADGRPVLSVLRHRQQTVPGAADQLSVAAAEAFARRLAPLHVGRGPAGQDALTGSTDLMDLLGLGDVHSCDLELAWRARPARDRLRVPVGVAEDGSPVHLDLKESAQQGMGPHGLVIGATGSGKSELLRTLVLGLAATHSPEKLNLVLVDFKGGATFAGMADLPHVSALITNLEQEITLVDRMQAALTGELIRRQEVLRAAGNLTSITEYEKARAGGQPLDPLPSLFICVDEFSELLSAKPEFIDLFVAIGRLGRSLGLHLLLASQRLEEGRLRGLDSHLSYRIGLRTFSAQESRAVLGVPDAYELPPVPGLAYLKPDPSTLVRFKAAYVSEPPPRMTEVGSGRAAAAIVPFTTAPVALPRLTEPAEPAAAIRRTPAEPRSVVEIAVDRLAGLRDQGRPAAHQVWLPPLDTAETLDPLLPDLDADAELGLVSRHWRERGDLVLPLGTVDRPLEQRRETLAVDLGGAGGHVAIVGGPRAGKSTLARTLVASLALTRTPAEAQVYVLDFGGGAFAPLGGLPHVAGVATRAEPDVVRRVVAEVAGIVDRREAYFRRNGIDSIETYRMRRRGGQADDGHGDVFLLVDGWSTLRAEFETLEMEFQGVAQRGLTFGVHLVVTAGRWADFRATVRDVFGTRLELRLADPIDSEVDRRLAANVPAGRPGRGLLPTKRHYLGALPRIDGNADAATLGQGIDRLVAAVNAAWPGAPAPKLRLLPELVTLDRVHAAAPAADRHLLLGIHERDLTPVGLDVDTEPHLLAFGDGQSGKSALLRTFLREVTRTRSASEAGIVVVDYRRALLGEAPQDYLVNYLTSSAQAGRAIDELAGYLRTRLPGRDVTPEQLRTRSWWSGAEVFVVVDDYDLVATSTGSPLLPLVELLPQARDIGLHLAVARRSGGAARALHEPVIQALRELSAPGIMLSGSPDEGPLIGPVRPHPAVPGRARFLTRAHGVEVMQLAWADPML